jgi:hypothetical protein
MTGPMLVVKNHQALHADSQLLKKMKTSEIKPPEALHFPRPKRLFPELDCLIDAATGEQARIRSEGQLEDLVAMTVQFL